MDKPRAIEVLKELMAWDVKAGDLMENHAVTVQDALRYAVDYMERKTGHWIEKDGWDGDVYYDCSACGESWTTIEGTPWDNDMNYCPHCGAKMEGENDDSHD